MVALRAVKPSRFLLAMAVLTASLHAADHQWVSVKSNSIQNGTLMVIADLQGKPTELFCEIKLPSCSQPEPGEFYSMQPATADEGIYADCTNVVLYSLQPAQKKVGVYCWANSGDCYMVRCVEMQVQTIPAAIPDNVLKPRTVAQDFSSALVAEFPSVQQRLAQNRDSEQVLVWAPVKKVCGRVRMVERGIFVPVPEKQLHLYEAKWRKPCCKNLKLIGTRITSQNGDFDFGNIQSGWYWLTVELDGVEHGTPIDVDPRHNWEGSCEVQGPDIEKNSFDWGWVTPIM